MQSIQENRLKKTLAEAYYAKEATNVHELWDTRVMSHIRRLGPLGPTTNFLMQFEALVWRFAPVACILIVALAVCMMRIDFVSEYEIATILINNPVEFVLIEHSVI
jgi:hypothetical protein